MVIAGEWFFCSDDIVRPVIRGEALAYDGRWIQVPFLVDSGADRTVFSGSLLAKLSLTPVVVQEGISGLGGAADSVVVETQLQFTRETGGRFPRPLCGRYWNRHAGHQCPGPRRYGSIRSDN